MRKNSISSLAHKAFIVIGLSFFLTANALAGLPTEVDGKRLPTLAPMLEKITPAVVNIAAIGEVLVRQRNSLLNDPFFRNFFDFPGKTQIRKTRSLGSGVVVDAKNGYVLTNHHVIDGAKIIIVNFKDGRQLEAKLIGSDPRTDVAVLKIPSQGLSAVPMSDSDKLRVGDFAIAIGNPFGLGQTVTSGIVSALGRSGLGLSGKGGNIEDFIQTDASINVGNSGGALVNLRGELIGINAAILSPNKGGNVGIGFAIPINMAKAIMQQLISHGEIRRGYFGVVVQTLTPELAEALKTNLKKGAIVASVENNSVAQKSGLRAHDIITKVNEKTINNATDMRNQIGLLNIGDKVHMVVHRGKTKLSINTIIEGGDSDGQIAAEHLDPRLAGATLTNIPADSPFYGRIKGIMVADIESGSPAVSAGLEEGDVIVSINRKAIANINDVGKTIGKKKGQLLMNIQRGRTAFFLLLR